MKYEILLTGGTGFLGTQIALNLIKNENVQLQVMVRAKNNEEAVLRLKRTWWDWPELIKALNNGINVIVGDITEENLGMEEELYKSLSHKLTHIINTVADLRLHAPLNELLYTNLQGTLNLLNFAKICPNFERFSHISTAYVAGKRTGEIKEEDLSDHYGFWSNYEESKYESEKAVINSGLPFSIFRPGMVVGNSKTGEIKTFNTIYVLLKLYLNKKLRVIPTSSSLPLNIVPVDYVAHGVTQLSLNPDTENMTFHLTAPHSELPNIEEFLEFVRQWARENLGTKLPKTLFIPISSFIQKLSSPSSQTRGLYNIMLTLAPYLRENRQFNQENVRKFLGTYKLNWKTYLPLLLKFAVYHGFFHRSERTVQEQAFFRLKSKSYPIKFYDIIQGKAIEKTSETLHKEIKLALASLQSLGIKSGDRVAIVGLNSTRYLTLELSIGLLGAVSVPLYYTSPPSEIKSILKDCNAKILFIGTPHLMKRLNEEDLGIEIISFCRESLKIPKRVQSWSKFLEKGEKYHRLPPIYSPVDFDDLATIRYTSGTTGIPKGVIYNHAHLRWMAESMASLPNWSDRNQEVRYLSFLPMNHVVEGILGTYSPYYAPAPLKIYFLEDFTKLPQALPMVRPRIFFSVPRLYEKIWFNLKKSFLGGHYTSLNEGPVKSLLKPLLRRYILHKIGLNKCAQLIVGSATSSQQLIQDYHNLGIEIYNAYGLTEAPLVTLNRQGKNRIGTVGEPLPETLIKIAKDGEIMVKGPQVTIGYFKQDINSPLSDGWLLTGDLGFLTQEGSLVIIGRKKELIINSYGKSIDPLKIEAMLRDTPGVVEVMLVGEGQPFICGLFWVEEDNDPSKIKKEIEKVNENLSRPEQIKMWALLSNDLSIDGGDLTANMKLKREIINKRYQNVIDALYHKVDNPLILYSGRLGE
jgi:long-chain acyl-CoA synthetase